MNECAHEPCDCNTDGEFCSDHCRTHAAQDSQGGSSEAHDCDCGHSECE